MNLLQLNSLLKELTKPAIYSAMAGIIGLGTVLTNSAPSEAQVTINVTGGSVSGNYFLDIIEDPTGTLITPYGVYTGPFAAGETNNYAFALFASTTFESFGNVTGNPGNNEFTGNAYVNGTSTPFAGNLNLTVDSPWITFGNVSKNITGGTITLNTPNTLTGFSFEPPVTSTAGSSTPGIPELTATTFTTPEPLTEPGGAGQAVLRSQGQQPQQFRPNGVHTRIIPTWTPGLYQ